MSRPRLIFALFTAIFFTAVSGAASGGALVSSVGNVGAVMEDSGFSIIPATDVRAVPARDELGPAQAFEIIRPNGEPIEIGRLNTSCSCVRLEAAKHSYGRGERAFLVLRNVRATPAEGQMYAFYAQITSPIAATLRHDTFMRSDRFRPRPQTDPSRQWAAYR